METCFTFGQCVGFTFCRRRPRIAHAAPFAPLPTTRFLKQRLKYGDIAAQSGLRSAVFFIRCTSPMAPASAVTHRRSFRLLPTFLLLLLPPLALSAKCPAPASASYPDLISAGNSPNRFPPFPLLSSQILSAGNTAFSKQSFAVAEACYARACISDPKQPLALSNRALAVMNQGRNDEAMKVRACCCCFRRRRCAGHFTSLHFSCAPHSFL